MAGSRSLPSFDVVARNFERDRALPSSVSTAIRQAVVDHGSLSSSSSVLEIGCGTGRIGAEFCAAGDDYVGIDSSIEMLHEFQRRNLRQPARLVHGDGSALPFSDGRFSAVMLMHVLTADNWLALLTEARRVLGRLGVLVIGRSEGPADGLDSTMRLRLDELLTDLGIETAIPDRGAMKRWLQARSSRRLEITAAAWTVERSPREFFQRKQSAARFASLPPQTREGALKSLAEWTEKNLGPLDAPRFEPQDFRLQLYWCGTGREPCAP